MAVAETTVAVPVPLAKQPVAYPDVCGRHRLQVEVERMGREIGFLQEELNSLEDLQPASRCCEEVNKLVGSNPDPLLPLNQKSEKRRSAWRRMWRILCLSFSWMCCSSKCAIRCRKPGCCKCEGSKCCCLGRPRCSSCKPRCGCCGFPRFSCPRFSCGCVLSCPKSSCLCPRCTGPCCMCRCLCP